MALVKCKECGKDVSTEAASCPHCGAPRPSAGQAVVKAASRVWTGVKLFIGLIVLVIVFQCTQRMSGDGGSTSNSASSGTTTTATTPVSSPTASPAWTYDTQNDPMTSKSLPVAVLRSVNSMDLDFPYKGPNYGHLMVRGSTKGQTEVAFFIDKGQTMCRSYEYRCKVTIRFDDAPALAFRGIGPSDNSTELAFLDQPAKFVAGAAKAKRILVSMDIFHAGTQVLEFTPSESLRWPPK